MNKAEVIQVIKNAPQELADEISYFLDVYSDDPDYNIFDALDDACDSAEYNRITKIFDQCKTIYIKIGYCVPVDISKVYVTSGKKYYFKYKGVYYDCVDSWINFVNSLT